MRNGMCKGSEREAIWKWRQQTLTPQSSSAHEGSILPRHELVASETGHSPVAVQIAMSPAPGMPGTCWSCSWRMASCALLRAVSAAGVSSSLVGYSLLKTRARILAMFCVVERSESLGK